MNNFSNIAEYISGFSDGQKMLLMDLYSIIKKHVPKKTTEKSVTECLPFITTAI